MENEYKKQVVDNYQDNFKCDKCEFIAKNAAGLKVHFQAKHTKLNMIKCGICDFTCESKDLLKTHNDNPCAPRK